MSFLIRVAGDLGIRLNGDDRGLDPTLDGC